MILSVIVPVYNMSKYLSECLDSVLNQQIEDMEVICLNDGSSDNSLDVLLDYQKKDSRIRVVDKENTGYGDTLNKGIAIAKGDYIAIVESDDLVVKNAFCLLLHKAEETSADVVKGNYFNYIQGSQEYYNNLRLFRDGDCINPKKNEQLFFVAPSVWTAIYKKSFLVNEQIEFLPTPGASYQDTSFAFKVWACANKVAIMHVPVISYRNDNPESSSNETGKPFQIIAEFEEMSKFLEERDLTELFPVLSRVRYISGTWNAHRLVREYKVLFLMKLREMFKEDHEKGYLVRKYWNDEDWRKVHLLIYSFEKYCEELGQGWQKKEIDNDMWILKDLHPCYIYGADILCSFVRALLSFFQIEIDAYIKTERKIVLEYYDDKPIVSLDQVTPEGIIILTDLQNIEQDSETLKRNGLYNFISLNTIIQVDNPLKEACRFAETYSSEILGLEQCIEKLERYKRTAIKLLDTDNRIPEWLISKHITNISVYGVGRLGKALLAKLKDTGIHVTKLVDRNRGEYKGIAIQDMDGFLENPGETQLVIITPLYEAETIGEALTNACGVKWISIERLLDD